MTYMDENGINLLLILSTRKEFKYRFVCLLNLLVIQQYFSLTTNLVDI